jgi:hypothetical protein
MFQHELGLMELRCGHQHGIIEVFRKPIHCMIPSDVADAAEKFQKPRFRHLISPPGRLTDD